MFYDIQQKKKLPKLRAAMKTGQNTKEKET